jgi:hypothetical protein
VVGAATLLAAPQSTREWSEEQDPLECLPVPTPAYYHDLRIHTPQPSICDAHPSSRPAYSALPLPCRPEQQRCDDTCDEAHFLQHVHHPERTASSALAIFARAQEYEVEEDDEVYRQEDKDECILPSSRAECEVL